MKQLQLFFLSLIFCWSAESFGQQSLNSYKYVIVPKQFDFQKKEDQYQLNSLTKFLFEREGYTVYWASESFPEDLAKNPCLGLKARVKNNSSMLRTKVNIELADCYNQPVYRSEEGFSKIKEFKKSYQQAIRHAFQELDTIPYKYNPNLAVSNKNVVTTKTPVKEKETAAVVVAANTNKEVEALKATEVKATNVEKDLVAVKNDAVNVATEVKKDSKIAEAVVATEVVSEVPKKEIKKTSYTLEGTYYIDMWGTCVISKKGDGYKVVGGDNFEFATVVKTSLPNMFMVKKTGFKDAQLLELDSNGNLKIDSKDGFKVYKRVN